MKNMVSLAVVLCIVLGTTGCFVLDERQVPPAPATMVTATPVPATTTGMSTVSAAAMALQLADLPDGYIIRDRADLTFSEVSELAREQGWQMGYFTSFYRMNAENYDITAISQRIGVYEIDNIHLVDQTMDPVFDAAESQVLAMANGTVSVTELPFPLTGDQTGSYRVADANEQYVTKYIVIFTKENVIEAFEMRGTTTDYELLKSLVAKAAVKIQ
jgi:hypothetical protein